MQPKFIDINGLSIAYIEKNRASQHSIFFIHGNSGSSATWKKQIDDPLFSQYRIIAFDLPGHGASSKSFDPGKDYTPIDTAKIIAKGISVLSNTAPFILVGISYGTNIIAEMINADLNPSGIVLMGTCCIGENFGMEKVFKPMDTPIFSYNEKDRKIINDVIDSLVNDPIDAQSIVTDYLKTDEQFKPMLMKGAADGKISDEITTLKNTRIPICIINGALDKMFYPDYIKNADLVFWKKDIAILENAGHFVHLDKPAEVNNIISTYAKEIFTTIRA
jgi:pimeloyl-ACP methyl ester carboxylesterase